MAQADNVGVVRMLWAAARENDVDALLSLTVNDVDWRPTAVGASGLHGHDALRDYLDGLRAAGRGRRAPLLVRGGRRLRHRQRRPAAAPRAEAIQHWWVYRVAGGKIAGAGSHDSRANAMRAARAGQARDQPRGERP